MPPLGGDLEQQLSQQALDDLQEMARPENLGLLIPPLRTDSSGSLQTPIGKRGWQWAMVRNVVKMFLQGLSRFTAAAIELLGTTFGGIVVSDRFSASLILYRLESSWLLHVSGGCINSYL